MKVVFALFAFVLGFQSFAFAGDVESTALKPYMNYIVRKTALTYQMQNNPSLNLPAINPAVCSAAGGALAIINLANNAKFDIAVALEASHSSISEDEFIETTRLYFTKCNSLPKLLP